MGQVQLVAMAGRAVVEDQRNSESGYFILFSYLGILDGKLKPSKKPKKPVTPCFKRDYKLQEIGRHDWTRTNDPYHVKVVL
jgi:hypothetical protein